MNLSTNFPCFQFFYTRNRPLPSFLWDNRCLTYCNVVIGFGSRCSARWLLDNRTADLASQTNFQEQHVHRAIMGIHQPPTVRGLLQPT